MEMRASMSDPRDGLYRLVLIGERGKLPLGVMEPEGDTLKLVRRPYQRDVLSLGRILRGEARRSAHFSGGNGWQYTEHPAQLFTSRWLRRDLEEMGPALWRREKGKLRLALPYTPQRRFPMEKLFCFAVMERIEGTAWAVYTFDGEEGPCLPEKI